MLLNALPFFTENIGVWGSVSGVQAHRSVRLHPEECSRGGGWREAARQVGRGLDSLHVGLFAW